MIPDNQKIGMDVFIPIERSMGAVSGHKVVAELTSYGERGRKPEGKIVEIIGHVNDPGTDILSIVKGYDLPMEFPEKVLNQAARVAKPVRQGGSWNGRKELRDVADGDRSTARMPRILMMRFLWYRRAKTISWAFISQM